MNGYLQHEMVFIQMAFVLLFGWILPDNKFNFNLRSTMVSIQESKKPMEEPHEGKQLVIIIRSDSGVTYSSGEFVSPTGSPVEALNNILKEYDVKVVPMISQKNMEGTLSILSNTYFIYPERGKLDELAEELREIDVIDAAYIKPAAEEPD